jgi:hypothetical protein
MVRVRATLNRILTEYGPLALVIYLGIFFTVLFGFWAAITFGWQPTGVGANVGAFAAAYIVTKFTTPFRVAATLALLPVAARVLGRTRKPGATEPTPPTER